MKSITDNTSTREPTDAHSAPLTSHGLIGVLRQGVTLLRTIGVVLILYLTFKFLLWSRRGAGPE